MSCTGRLQLTVDVSNTLKTLIRSKGHTYESLGREIGISPQAVSEIVNGRTKGATSRYALAAALGLHPSDLWPEGRSRGMGHAAD
jgi:transcriptional regulator with XRE-family HTH domain